MPNYLFKKKRIINFMELFEKHLFFSKINNFKIIFFLQIYRNAEIIGNKHLFPLHNEPSLMPVG